MSSKYQDIARRVYQAILKRNYQAAIESKHSLLTKQEHLPIDKRTPTNFLDPPRELRQLILSHTCDEFYNAVCQFHKTSCWSGLVQLIQAAVS